MSLLLEALKKAEKAKEEAQRRAKGDAAPASMAEIRLEPAEPAPVEKPVMTRPELPDIRQPLEILSDEIAPKQPEPAPRADAVASGAAERAAARKVFEAKFKESNPRLPFYIAMGVLGFFALGTVGYFWYELRPPPPLVNTNPAPRTAEQVAAPEPRPAAPAPLAAAPAPIPGLPVAAPARAPGPMTPATKPLAEVTATPKPAPEPRVAAPRLAAPRPAAAPAAQTR